LIPLSVVAERQLRELLDHFANLGRPEAQDRLLSAVDEASARIELTPDVGLSAPRPYPQLARAGERWLKIGRYWIAYGLQPVPTIIAVFYDSADIPNRR
jgi:plasmid stabilization system protein ParE